MTALPILPPRPDRQRTYARVQSAVVLVCAEPGCTRAAGHDGALSGRLLHRDAEGRYWRGAERLAPSGAVAGQESVSAPQGRR